MSLDTFQSSSPTLDALLVSSSCLRGRNIDTTFSALLRISRVMLWNPHSVLIAAALLVPSIDAQNQCFDTRIELKNATVAYLANNSSTTLIATTYGWPIGSWCVGNVKDFSGIFEGAIGFNEPLNTWVRTCACV